MSLDILKKRIKENKLSGVYLFIGREEYTKDHYAEILRKKVDQAPLPEFNHVYFNAAAQSTADLEDAFFALPYMSDFKLIEITNLADARIDETDASEYDRIFSDVPDYLAVLAVLRSEEYGDEQKGAKSAKSGINAFAAAVKDHGLVVEFGSEDTDKLTPWIVRHFNAAKVGYEPAVPRELLNYCGSDMYVLQGEIEKLCLAYNGTPLTVADVKKYCCANNAYKFFDISMALNRRDMVLANSILNGLDLSRDELPAALGLIAKNYSDMLLVKTGIDSGKSPDQIAKDLKIPAWRVSKIASAVRGSDIRSIVRAISHIAAADKKMKSSRTEPRRALEMAFYRICTNE